MCLHLANLPRFAQVLLRRGISRGSPRILQTAHSPLSWHVVRWFHAATTPPKSSKLEIPAAGTSTASSSAHGLFTGPTGAFHMLALRRHWTRDHEAAQSSHPGFNVHLDKLLHGPSMGRQGHQYSLTCTSTGWREKKLTCSTCLSSAGHVGRAARLCDSLLVKYAGHVVFDYSIPLCLHRVFGRGVPHGARAQGQGRLRRGAPRRHHAADALRRLRCGYPAN